MTAPATTREARKRMAASYGLSLAMHLLLALFFFAIVASQQNGPEGSTSSTTIYGVSAPANRTGKTAARSAAHAAQRRIGPAATIRIAGAKRPSAQRRELARIVNHAPPQATPAPLATSRPAVATTAAPLEPLPLANIAALPHPVPTYAPVTLATAAPSAQPSAAAPAPTARASTPVPNPAPATAKPSAAPAAPAGTASPRAAAAAPASSAPSPAAARPGPSALPAARAGSAANPGSQGRTTAGRSSGASGAHTTAGLKKPPPLAPLIKPPVLIRATPSPPAPRPTRSPAARKSSDINARLRALIPNNPVTYSQKRATTGIDTARLNAEPQPPDEVLRRTQYVLRTRRTLLAADTVTYVSAVYQSLGMTMCAGWRLTMHPYAPPPARYNGGPQFPGPPPPQAMRAQIDEHAEFRCNRNDLTPYRYGGAPAPGGTPGP